MPTDSARNPNSASAPGTARPDRFALAERLRKLHTGPEVLVLPNAWDVASARLLATVDGVEALATTSAGIAAAHGLPDGQSLDRADMLTAVERITTAIELPVTADLESGYGDTPEQVADTIDAGAVGANLEDAPGPSRQPLIDPARQAESIAAARDSARARNVPLVLNARTDTYWRAVGDPDTRFADTVARLRRYRQAGADCLFVPGLPPAGIPPERARAVITELVTELEHAPINLLAGPALPPIPELRRLGIRRVSVGSGLYRLSLAAARTAMSHAVHGDAAALSEEARPLPYSRLSELLGRTP
ncbi:2-methylisocitrate lyase-like PEP mutase family enzyme [Saccharopolyspora lacisalsi]|uniref:2-methylisocitrate lyase-like PEP mutase family enzyme n=1 Tax=Halosaccharopolyspora lacisalsi TaxID=1000566 RepID=A0A839E459_9PSEU|nr:isocitrate lyase/phosphoenolpyruvate mutase family protein [Halosaccharopolyspora lacisalsi]MBA8826517.1 2-methylisocitrate lyase-like PEP mutase family enzyme [Halosaccharopolyspora lacisalsi]